MIERIIVQPVYYASGTGDAGANEDSTAMESYYF
jgi:hypothetical protein